MSVTSSLPVMAIHTGKVLVKLVAALLGSAAVLLAAQDISGTWKGTSEFVNRDGETRTGSVQLTLKQNAQQVTGTAGPSAERQNEIRKGKVDGDKLTFEVPDPTGLVEIGLTIGENTLRGEAKFHREYGLIIMKLELRRE